MNEKWYGIRPDGRYLTDHEWYASTESKGYEVFAPVSDESGNVICLVVACAESIIKGRALDKVVDDRARLISLAPEMAEALRECVAGIEQHSAEKWMPHRVERARALLAKLEAEG